jgi:G:T-mismatch repair DNA endonuclease (very short patch repair protein)/predicted transcriptional regulator
MNSSEEPLECMLCGLKSFSLGRHIVAKHSMTTQEYKNKFPGCEVNKLTQLQIEKMKLTKSLKDSRSKELKLEGEKRKQETIDSGLKPLVCQICGFESLNSLISHITKKHNVTMHVYRETYPDSKVQQASPSQRKSNSKAMKEKLSDSDNLQAFLNWRSFPSEEKHWLKKGFSEEEAKEKVTQFQRIQSLKGNNEVTRKKRSEKNVGEKNPMSLASIASREGVSKKEAAKLTPCFGRSGEKHPMFGKHHTEEAIQKIANAPHLTNPEWRSKPELEIASHCLQITNKLITNIALGKWNVDILFVEKRLIIEFFGDFWHMNPKRYSPLDVHNVMKKSAEQIWERDARKLKELSEQGYTVLVIWESDWRENDAACIERIKDAYYRTP